VHLIVFVLCTALDPLFSRVYPLSASSADPAPPPMLSLYAAATSPPPPAPKLASQALIHIHPVKLDLSEGPLTRIASFFADGVIVKRSAIAPDPPDGALRSLRVLLDEVDVSVPVKGGKETGESPAFWVQELLLPTPSYYGQLLQSRPLCVFFLFFCGVAGRAGCVGDFLRRSGERKVRLSWVTPLTKGFMLKFQVLSVTLSVSRSSNMRIGCGRYYMQPSGVRLLRTCTNILSTYC
jgi:hypothetical protein